MKKNYKKGIALFIAVIAVSALMLISLAISDISYKEQIISYSGRDSKVAFYSADAGLECSLFHDLKGGTDEQFKFATSSNSVSMDSLYCVTDASGDLKEITPILEAANSTTATTTFYFNVSPELDGENTEVCTVVQVVKRQSTLDPAQINTKIESRGYNNICDAGKNPGEYDLVEGKRNLERSFRVTY